MRMRLKFGTNGFHLVFIEPPMVVVETPLGEVTSARKASVIWH